MEKAYFTSFSNGIDVGIALANTDRESREIGVADIIKEMGRGHCTDVSIGVDVATALANTDRKSCEMG